APPLSPRFPYTTLFRSGPGSARPDAAPGAVRGGAPWDNWSVASGATGPIRRNRLAEAAIAGIAAVVLLVGALVYTHYTNRRDNRSEEHTSELQSPYDLV